MCLFARLRIQVDEEVESPPAILLSSSSKIESKLFKELNGGLSLNADIEDDLEIIAVAAESNGVAHERCRKSSASKLGTHAQTPHLGYRVIKSLHADHASNVTIVRGDPETTLGGFAEVCLMKLLDVGAGVSSGDLALTDASFE
jgi:hypothetical protein